MRFAVVLAALGATLAGAPAAARDACAALIDLHDAGMTITLAATAASPLAIDPALGPDGGNAPLCRVDGYLTPTPDSHIGFEVWLPAPASWNRKLHSVGNGGFLGALNRKAMLPGIRRGYATMTTDLGHLNTPPGTPEDAQWAIGHPDRIVDYAYRAEHVSTVAAKRVIAAYYTQALRHAFYTGCSAGGIQGLNELLRYPHDYDGYIVGAATPDHLGQEVGAMWNTLAASLGDPSVALRPGQAAALHTAVLRACVGTDGGAPDDRFLTDPLACRLPAQALACVAGQDEASCLNPAQVAIVGRIYGGPVDPQTGAALFSGLTRGTELGWQRYFLGKKNPVPLDRPWAGFMALMAYADTTWIGEQRYRAFDFGRDLADVRQRMVGGEMLVSAWTVASRDLDSFRAAGGKVIQYHGWDDPNIPAAEAVRFHDALVADLMTRHHLSAAAAEKALSRSYRLFMLPGMGHCAGGAGVDSFGQGGTPAGADPDQDALGALERWVEHRASPDRFLATRKEPEPGEGAFSRPLCPWPAIAAWDGHGDAKNPASFACAPRRVAVVTAP